MIKCGLLRPDLPDNRVIPVGQFSKSGFVCEKWSLEKMYGNNRIRTSRYQWYTFFFQNLYEQAQRIANFYFICLGIIQVNVASAVSPATSILPLIFVIGVSMAKQGYEDFQRHKHDRELNSTPVELVSENGTLVTAPASQIRVGDVVLIRSGDSFPCDLVLISSSEPNGECFVTTASLDGETNLKIFHSISATKSMGDPRSIADHLAGMITCQQPVSDFYKFHGSISITDRQTGTESLQPLSPECLLLRGARLKNTDFVYGCAVYTGEDTKMSLNSKAKHTKYSQIEEKLNGFLVVYLIGLFFICLLCTVLKHTTGTKSWHTIDRPVTTWNVAQDFFAAVILLNVVIPLSLYVTIELQKFVGVAFFGWDLKLYDNSTDQPAMVNTSDIPEDLGQVCLNKLTHRNKLLILDVL